MKLRATIGDKEYALGRAHDISIPVRFEGKRLSVFGAPAPKRVAHEDGGFVGDVSRGGSCNCDTLTFTPHTSGTHTESIGHIASVPIYVCEVLKDALFAATLITIAPTAAGADTYDPACRPTDKMITRTLLEAALKDAKREFLQALVVRTLPNEESKITQAYGEYLPPFFSVQAMEYIVSLGVRHVLVDMPSIDRLDDEGKLTNHHIFWETPRGRPVTVAKNASTKTVTELIYVPQTVADGRYALNLQVAPLAVDGAPSRPLLYEIET